MIDIAPVPVRAGNSLVDGWSRRMSTIPWRELDFATAWASPANQPGRPYLNAFRRTDDTLHRVYSQRRGSRPELREGVWWWV